MRLRPLRLSLRTRLAVLYTALLAVALVAFGGGGFLVLRDQLEGSFEAGLLANAEHAAGAFALDVDQGGQLRPSARLLEQLASTGGRVVVLDATGRMLADSTPGAPELPIGSADLAQAAQDSHATPSVAVAGQPHRLAVDAIRAGGTLVGYVAWASPTASLDSLLGTVAGALLLGGILLVGAAFLIGWFLARRALAPVVEVTETARAISLSGDFAARVETQTPHDEVGELALAFNEMLTALEQNHHTLRRFLGDASHQLRTPLTTIRANLDLAQRTDLPADERAAILADARDEAERMGRLIADLLSLARAESGARLAFGPVELDALLVEQVRRQRQAARHVAMSVTAVEPAIIDGDRDRLRELLGILLDNAARYTPAGGSVMAGLEVHDGRAVLRVEDTGIGLDDEDPAKVFERLYRGRRARELRPGGTGLGLAIARWIAEAHGGTIALAARDERGTVATVSLPLRPS